jgi:hypothetical protein
VRFVAVVPAAPALLPELTGGPIAELEPVRRATAAALQRLVSVLGDGAAPLVVIAPGDTTRRLVADTVTGLDGFGISVGTGTGTGTGIGIGIGTGIGTGTGDASAVGPALALHLLATAGTVLPPDAILVHEVDVREPAARCRRLGAALAAESGPRAVWLVLGDGSARRSPKAPGAFDADAEAFDECAAKALDAADPAALEALDAERATRLMAAGRAPWQVLAGAVDPAPDAFVQSGVTFHEAPFGVGYIVATWDFPPGGAARGGPSGR